MYNKNQQKILNKNQYKLNFPFYIEKSWPKNILKLNFYILFIDMRKMFYILIFGILFSWLYCLWEEYTTELKQAYKWAYKNEITTMNSIDRANIKWNITREEMAKMISNYAVNILWKAPDTTKSCLFSDSNINPGLVQFVTESCQLWLMWQWVTSFRPKDSVTRAEFWTVLSRALRWNKNEWWSTYYENHLKALKSEWIMTKIDTPMNKEVRGYVMLMLMRSAWEEISNPDISNTDNQISDVIWMLD